MKIYRHTSESWYMDAQPFWMRLLRWLISTGWDMPDWTPAGYSYRWRAREAVRLAIRARGHRSRAWAIYDSLCPLSLFGGRVTFQAFGVNYYRRRVQGWYCLHWGHGKRHWQAYRSHNATPWGADTWYIGAPREVVRAAQAHIDQRLASDAERTEREAAHAP